MCKECEEEIKIIDTKKITFISKSDRRGYNLYKFEHCGHLQEIQVSAVNTNKYKCKTCIDLKQKQEAKEHGLDLIEVSSNPQNRIYKFITCGHIREMNVTAVRKGNFKCVECHDIEIMKELDLMDLSFISKGSRDGYNIYKFNKCGHIKELNTVAIRNKQIQCKECIEENIKNEAILQKLTIVGTSESNLYRNYKFDSCGHTQELRTCAVKKGIFECKTCLSEKLNKEAKNANLILINILDKSGYGLYKLPCGHTQEISYVSVRNNTFACRTCNGLFLSNGLLVKSHYEQLVGDFILENKVAFEYDKRLGTKTQHKTDYYIKNKDLYIEVAGGYDGVGIFKDYSEKLKIKHDLYYTDKNILYIYPNDFKNDIWKNKLKEAM